MLVVENSLWLSNLAFGILWNFCHFVCTSRKVLQVEEYITVVGWCSSLKSQVKWLEKCEVGSRRLGGPRFKFLR